MGDSRDVEFRVHASGVAGGIFLESVATYMSTCVPTHVGMLCRVSRSWGPTATRRVSSLSLEQLVIRSISLDAFQFRSHIPVMSSLSSVCPKEFSGSR